MAGEGNFRRKRKISAEKFFSRYIFLNILFRENGHDKAHFCPAESILPRKLNLGKASKKEMLWATQKALIFGQNNNHFREK